MTSQSRRQARPPPNKPCTSTGPINIRLPNNSRLGGPATRQFLLKSLVVFCSLHILPHRTAPIPPTRVDPPHGVTAAASSTPQGHHQHLLTSQQITSEIKTGLNNLQELANLLQQNGPGIGVVLGVGPDGAFPRQFLKLWNTGVLYLCDPFIHLVSGYDDAEFNVSDVKHQENYENLSRLLFL